MRKFIRKLHKWLSIPAGIIITITCLTGAILVFQDEILELANPSHYFVEEIKKEPIPLDELILIVNGQLKDNSVANVKISFNPERTYTMGLSEGFRISAFVDQYTGKVKGLYEFRENPFFTVMSIHRWLMDGTHTWGKITVGVATLLFAFILISGFILWMPREFKKSRFKIQTRKGKKRLFYDLHNVLGAYASLILLICALSGLMWSFDWYRNGIFGLFGAESPQQGRGGGNSREKGNQELNIAHWQDIVNELQKSNTNNEYIRIENGKASVHQKNMITSRAMDEYQFEAKTGKITKIILYKDQPKTSRIWGWTYSLHVGNYWGIWSKILTFIAALIGASLPITGYYIFYIKNRKRKK